MNILSIKHRNLPVPGIALALATLFSAQCFAANYAEFWWAAQTWACGGAAFLRDTTTYVPTGYVGYAVWSLDNVADAPTTNPPQYLATDEVLSTHPDSGTRIGEDYVYRLGLADGEVIAVIQNGIRAAGYGYLRAFSDTSVTKAAYYGDSDVNKLDTEPNGTIYYASSAICNVVNPAYNQLQFDGDPMKYKVGATWYISGSVNSTVSGGNNELANGAVMVYYSIDDGASWSALGGWTISGNGDFSGTYPGGSIAAVGVPGGDVHKLPNSLVEGAQGSVQVLPEPGMAILLASGLLALRFLRNRNTRCSR